MSRSAAALIVVCAVIGAGVAYNWNTSNPVTPNAVVAKMTPSEVSGFCEGYRLSRADASAALYRALFVETFDQRIATEHLPDPLPTGDAVYTLLLTRC